ncbi:hypothetical protein BS47DRAFT_531003 [Hydnum rufescens UP504]|uniref:Uncharacterized protein n=1 Tax=Hydnum rufescens UP504 TaxID=1448309 RepID=A0A9P6B469_9AGAM|nr:hypothetical protein BS47DRAFT_531003 [Hydnum rufescens UP504]
MIGALQIVMPPRCKLSKLFHIRSSSSSPRTIRSSRSPNASGLPRAHHHHYVRETRRMLQFHLVFQLPRVLGCTVFLFANLIYPPVLLLLRADYVYTTGICFSFF